MRSNMPLPVNGPVSVATLKTLRPGTVFAAATRSAASYTSQEYFNPGYQGLRLIIDTNSMGGAGTLAVKVQIKDPATGEWIDLTGATTASITTATQTFLTIHPSVPAAANVTVALPVPISFRIIATVGVNDVNFSVAGELLA